MKFFLRALYESAQDATKTIDAITVMHIKNVALIKKMGRATNSTYKVFEYLESNPIIDIKKTSIALNMAFNTVSGAVVRLVDAGILIQSNDASRNRTFIYEEYLAILRSGTE